MKWEVRKTESGKWGIFLKQEFCRTDEPVCYMVSTNETNAKAAVVRMNKESDEAADEAG